MSISGTTGSWGVQPARRVSGTAGGGQDRRHAPCSVIVQEAEGVGAEVAGIDPAASIRAVGNPKLDKIANQVREKLKAAIARL